MAPGDRIAIRMAGTGAREEERISLASRARWYLPGCIAAQPGASAPWKLQGACMMAWRRSDDPRRAGPPGPVAPSGSPSPGTTTAARLDGAPSARSPACTAPGCRAGCTWRSGTTPGFAVRRDRKSRRHFVSLGQFQAFGHSGPPAVRATTACVRSWTQDRCRPLLAARTHASGRARPPATRAGLRPPEVGLPKGVHHTTNSRRRGLPPSAHWSR